MSRSFLALCQDVVADLGVTGGQISAVTGLTSIEQQRIVNWVARADLLIQQVWSDWKFLWVLDNVTLAQGADTINATYAFNDIDHRAMVFNAAQAGIAPQYPVWMEWEQFYFLYQSKVKGTQAYPTCWAVDPTGKIWFSHYASAALPVQLSYWKQPARMVNGTDTSPIPTGYDTVIVERAKMLYAQRENAPEILTGSSAEYDDLMDKLQSSFLPGGRAARKSRNDATTNNDGYVE